MKAFYPDFLFVYGDAEFTPNLHGSRGLVSLALHSTRGSIYMVNADCDREAFCASDFRRDNIWSKLPLHDDGSGFLDLRHPDVKPYDQIAKEVGEYFNRLTGGQHYRKHVGFLADHGTRDMQNIHDLFDNDWFNVMPESVPRRPFHDLATLEDIAGVENGRLPDGTPVPQKAERQAHHALYDAEYDRILHEFLLEHSQAVRIACGVEWVRS